VVRMRRGDIAAIGLGLATGARSFIAAAMLATTPLLFNDAARFIVWSAATGELIADKQSDMGPRTSRRGLTLRLLSAGRCGYATADPRGCALAIAVALPVVCCASLVRRRENASRWDGYVEDALAIAVAVLAAHSINYPSPRLEAGARNFWWLRLRNL
jgi:hypothetical protein